MSSCKNVVDDSTYSVVMEIQWDSIENGLRIASSIYRELNKY